MASLKSEAQIYKRHAYQVKDGLPTDVVKDIIQDSLGFIWLATDEGLVKFNGHRFQPYKQALHSQFAKQFLRTRSGAILLIGDLDFIEIINHIDTVEFKPLLVGTRNPTDSTLWYPKSLYEDKRGHIWIGEPQSVVRWKRTSFQRFSFAPEDQTPVFTRSFSFFEDTSGELYAVSYPGRLFRFNEQQSRFESTAQWGVRTNCVLSVGSHLWIAAADGLYRASISAGQVGAIQKVHAMEEASAIAPLADGRLVVTTFGASHFLLNPQTGSLETLPLQANDINRVFGTKAGVIWAASSEGAIVLQENLFRPLEQPQSFRSFIESIAEDRQTGTIYFATSEELFSVKRIREGQPKIERIERLPQQYFQSLLVSNGRLWAANRMDIFVYENDRRVKSWNLERDGRFIFDLAEDADGNIWASQDGSKNAICITPDFRVKRVSVPLSDQVNLNVIRATRAGVVAGASGRSSYLFLKRPDDSTFQNISVEPSFGAQGDVTILDILETADAWWLASSEGLLRYADRKLERVFLGDQYTQQAVRTVERFSNEEILFGNAFGVFLYHTGTGDWSIYNDGTGLPSNSISNRGLFLTENGTLWVATSKGIAYSARPINTPRATPSPWIEQVTVNGQSVRFINGLATTYQSFLEFDVASQSYAPGIFSIQYRLYPGDWQDVAVNRFSLANLAPGNQQVQVRAKQIGGFSWSEPRTIRFYVQKPFWQQVWFLVSVGIVLFLVALVSYQWAQRVGLKRRQTLEHLLAEITSKNQQLEAQAREINLSHRELQEKSEEVHAQAEELAESYETIQQLNEDLEKKVLEKSRDLLQTNEELSKYNADLLQFSYSISHNLRGPLARLMGLSELLQVINDPAEVNRILEMIKVSTVELDTVLRDLTNIIELRKNVSHIRDKVFFHDEWSRCCVLLHDQILPEFVVRAEFASAPFIYGVRGLLQSILYNLFSNALKYRSHDRPLIIQARTWRHNNETVFQITDNGLGFDLNEQQTKVFKLYKRFHTHVQGRGLGLYLVKTQTELLGGRVEVQSQLNEGTTFTILLPDPESIERQVFYESETALLFYDANVNCTVINWKKEVTSQSYRAVFETVLNTLRTYHSPGWIADLRQQGIVPEEDQKWFANTILPEAVKNGLRRIATIGFRDPARVAYYERMQQRASGLGFHLQDFDSLPLALDWMAGGFRLK